MPPKAKFTKAEIIEAALNIVRADGYEALTSRALGTYLGSSARPIFTVFKNMEEVQQDMIKSANHIDSDGCLCIGRFSVLPLLLRQFQEAPAPSKAGKNGTGK